MLLLSKHQLELNKRSHPKLLNQANCHLREERLQVQQLLQPSKLPFNNKDSRSSWDSRTNNRYLDSHRQLEELLQQKAPRQGHLDSDRKMQKSREVVIRLICQLMKNLKREEAPEGSHLQSVMIARMRVLLRLSKFLKVAQTNARRRSL